MKTFPQPGDIRDLAGIQANVAGCLTWHLYTRHGAGDLDGLDLPELTALLADVLQNILVLLLKVHRQ